MCANYQTILWKKSIIPFQDLTVPEDHDWMMTENEDLDGNWCAEDFCQNWWILSNIQPEDSEDGDDCETFSGVFDRESSGREVPACSDHLLLVKAVVENPKLSFQRATTQKCGIQFSCGM